MSYIKQGFTKGQTLKADHLNYIEDGIVALSEGGSGVEMFNCSEVSTVDGGQQILDAYNAGKKLIYAESDYNISDVISIMNSISESKIYILYVSRQTGDPGIPTNWSFTVAAYNY